jgi:hypothetical protein
LPDFKDLKKNIERTQQLSRQVIDNFLIYYAASKDRLDRLFENRIKPYRHITDKMPNEWRNFLKNQFIAHKIFKSGGLISKYLNYVEVGYRSNRELEFLEYQKEHPWRFSFNKIVDNPHSDFYTMQDLFYDQEYLLYSPSVTKALFDMPDISTWFNLIGLSGKCMQTFGTVAYFRSFDREDIIFYARELDHSLESDSDITEHIEEHPLPYAMLWSGATLPRVVYKDHMIRHVAARYIDDDFRSEMLDQHFGKEFVDNVYKLLLKNWHTHPHHAKAYYDEEENILHLTAMTIKGFEKLVDALNDSGYDLPTEPHDNVSHSMRYIASDILKREIKINPFENLFDQQNTEDADDQNLDALNDYISMLVEAVNSGKEPNIAQMAEAAGIDLETAADVAEHMLNQIKNSSNR